MIDGNKDLQPIVAPRLQETVVVVGAGLAGMAAAREFAKAGLDVLILEANHRAGGRCFTMVRQEYYFTSRPLWVLQLLVL